MKLLAFVLALIWGSTVRTNNESLLWLDALGLFAMFVLWQVRRASIDDQHHGRYRSYLRRWDDESDVFDWRYDPAGPEPGTDGHE